MYFHRDSTSAPTLGEGLANRDFNSEVLATSQFLEDSHIWAESVRIELLFVVSARLRFVQNEKSCGGLPSQEEGCLEAWTKTSVQVWTSFRTALKTEAVFPEGRMDSRMPTVNIPVVS